MTSKATTISAKASRLLKGMAVSAITPPVVALSGAFCLTSCDRDEPTPSAQVEREPGLGDTDTEAERRIEERIEALDRKIEETEDELSQFGDAVSEEVREEWRALEDERRALAAEFEELRAGAYQTLQDAVVSLERRLEELREDLSEVTDEKRE